jgi:hypothetical protein
MTKLQMAIIEELENLSLYGIAQAARLSWENEAPYFCRLRCPFELRLKFAEANRELFDTTDIGNKRLPTG